MSYEIWDIRYKIWDIRWGAASRYRIPGHCEPVRFPGMAISIDRRTQFLLGCRGAHIERPAGKGINIRNFSAKRCHITWIWLEIDAFLRAVNDRPYKWMTIGCLEFDGDSYTWLVTTWLSALRNSEDFDPIYTDRYRAVPKGRAITDHGRHDLAAALPPTSYELNNLPLFFFTINRYNQDKRFNQMSFSFSSPLFCCRVPAARQRVFCCFLGFLWGKLEICRILRSLRTSDRCHWCGNPTDRGTTSHGWIPEKGTKERFVWR